jgi:hypothetical protein
MKARINKAIKSTNGYKTKSAAFVFLALQLLGDKIPLTPGNKEIVVNLIELLMASGLLHDLWRNREPILEWTKKLFTNKKLILWNRQRKHL